MEAMLWVLMAAMMTLSAGMVLLGCGRGLGRSTAAAARRGEPDDVAEKR
jgi:hypothetical protein